MITYIIRRILVSIPLLLGISILSFLIIQLAPGDPTSLFLDPNIKPEDREAFIEAYGLNDPVYIQYFHWLWQILHGNFGQSLIMHGIPVSELILGRLPNTLLLMVSSAVLAFIISIPFGVLSATKPYTLTDYTVTTASFIGVATPSFWIGLVLLMFFAVKFPIFPSGGVATLNAPFSIWDRLHHLILPAFVLAASDMAGLTRYTRSSMLDVLRQDYIRTARAKGFNSRKVVYKHGLRNALIPVVTIVGLIIPSFIGGAVVVENIFGWPGIGNLFLNAAFQRDYPVIMALTMISATLVVIGNLISDILYAIIDPRIEY
ncbi:ABC transporter permease [Tuberibacillus calidus]|uniref:ABC transporter permease n=1 Tax=Tuberibacillus calidus TaxID=340097 RepID=UPI0003F68D27|nr:ABC transporter permease [Tuberibacillus calidus]